MKYRFTGYRKFLDPDGYPAIDQVTGKVFQAAACNSQTCGTSSTATPGLYLNIGTPDATGTLHFLDATASGPDFTKLIKIADKISNVRARIVPQPSAEEREDLIDYVNWAEKVVAGCRGANAALDRIFDDTVKLARSSL